MIRKTFFIAALALALNPLHGQTLLDSQTSSSGNYGSMDGTYLCSGASFTPSVTASLDTIFLYLHRVGSPTAYFRVAVYAHGGVYGTSSVPQGPSLGVSDSVSSALLGESSAATPFRFTASNRVLLQAGVHYVFILTHLPYGVNATNFVKTRRGADGSLHGGNRCYSTLCATWFSSTSADMMFSAYGTPYVSAGNILKIGQTPMDNIGSVGRVPWEHIGKVNTVNR